MTFQSEYKIGISKDSKARRQQVSKAIGGAKLIREYKFPNAKSVEKFLHSTFADSRFTMKNVGKGAGKTEWFYLTPMENVALEFMLWWKHVEQDMWVAIGILLLAVLAGFLINKTMFL